MCPHAVAAAITPRTKALIPVMINGVPAHMDELMALAEEHSLAVIEDCAQCYLSYYKGKLVGSIGDFASWSFQGSKHVTCGDGGILCCSNEEMGVQPVPFHCMPPYAPTRDSAKSGACADPCTESLRLWLQDGGGWAWELLRSAFQGSACDARL